MNSRTLLSLLQSGNAREMSEKFTFTPQSQLKIRI